MNPAARLAAFAAILAASLGAGALVGSAAGPIDVDSGNHAETASTDVGGILVSRDGYTLEPETRVLGDRFEFRITDPHGDALATYDLRHERELHLVVVADDLGRYLHLHPERDATGRWSVGLPGDLGAGTYRVIADFDPAGGDPLSLGVDAFVPGPTRAPAEPVPSRLDTVDGDEVVLDGHLRPGELSEVAITVRRDGAVLATEPYLGAGGHLVAVRAGDLAYLHVHPREGEDGEPGDPVRFGVEVPSQGTYALFFDFRLGGEVRTAAFVLTTEEEGHR